MVTTDSNGVVFYEDSDQFTPVHTMLNLQGSALSEIVTDLNNQSKMSVAATTVPITDTTNFGLFGGAGKPLQIIRFGNIVQFAGELQGKTENHVKWLSRRTFATIPNGFRPTNLLGTPNLSWVMQGSGNNRWYLEITPGGTASASRFGPGDDTGDNTWLPFTCTYITTDPWPGG